MRCVLFECAERLDSAGVDIGILQRLWDSPRYISLSEVSRTLLVMEPLDERQIRALRKASGITTLKIFLDMNDFMLDLATKGGRKDEMEKLARIVYGTKQNHRISRKRDRCFLNNQQKTKFERRHKETK